MSSAGTAVPIWVSLEGIIWIENMSNIIHCGQGNDHLIVLTHLTCSAEEQRHI